MILTKKRVAYISEVGVTIRVWTAAFKQRPE